MTSKRRVVVVPLTHLERHRVAYEVIEWSGIITLLVVPIIILLIVSWQ